MAEAQTLKSAKQRMKKGFWEHCEKSVRESVEEAKRQGVNESKAERYFIKETQKAIAGEKEDEFYLRVKEMLLSEGEVSDAIGRLPTGNIFPRFPMKKSSATRSL